MKKESKTNASCTTEKKDIFNMKDIPFYPHETTMKDALKEKDVTRYPLSDGVTLSIYESDKDYDFASLNVFGLSVSVRICAGKKGMFISYPSYKSKDGTYKEYVSNFSKTFNDKLKETISAHYEG